jgi:antitoxin component HigA of HigAB toxin-antitoxin module
VKRLTVRNFPIRPIRTEADYQAALQLVAPYFDNDASIADRLLCGTQRGVS